MKIIKGTLEYEIHITEKDYELKASPKLEDELAALIIVNMLTGYSKDTISKSISKSQGKILNVLKDRLGKLNSTQSIVQLMSNDYVREFLSLPEAPEQADATTQEPIMGLEDIQNLNKTENI